MEIQQQLKQLRTQFNACTRCPLGMMGRKQVVFGQGNVHARLMFVGEGPGRDEDREGAPFVGRAGQLLTKIIDAMGLSRDEVYISNVVKCRPPNNRTPLPNESATCMQLILNTEIKLIAPEVICALGSTAARALLGDDIRISHARGTFFKKDSILILPTYHPAYLLRNPEAKIDVWHDMLLLCKHLNITPGFKK
jgi:uracil-DNA glycosylase